MSDPRCTVFIVEDHAIVRDGLRAMLDASGYRVLGEAADVGAALADIDRLRPAVALLDLSLANGESGFKVLTEIHKRQLGSRVLVLTMWADPQRVGQAVLAGASGYVLKACAASELLQAVDAVADGRKWFAPAVAGYAAAALSGARPLDPLARLTARERQILEMVAHGGSSASIGAALHLSEKTVSTFRARFMKKLGLSNVASLVRLAIREGVIDPSV